MKILDVKRFRNSIAVCNFDSPGSEKLLNAGHAGSHVGSLRSSASVSSGVCLKRRPNSLVSSTSSSDTSPLIHNLPLQQSKPQNFSPQTVSILD